jgi:hypothetical protein
VPETFKKQTAMKNSENHLETLQYRGKDIEIFYDQDAESPDAWGNTERFIVYDHRDFCVERKGYDPEEILQAMQEKKKLFDGFYYFPVFAYIHSGVSLSLGNTRYPFNDRWDTSFRGFALIKREKGTFTYDKAMNAAQGLIDTLRLYQREYETGSRETSGVEELRSMVNEGFFPLSIYVDILPAIIEYQKPYTLSPKE